jgi:hypothetical protein
MTVTEKPLYGGVTRELNSSNNWTTGPTMDVTGRFENVSANNHWPARRRKGQISSDVGSNWTAFASDIEMSPFYLDVQCYLGSGTYHGYQGSVLCGHDWRNFDAEDFFNLPLGYSTEPDLIGQGTTAISRVLPTNPIVDLPVAVAELLREGLPSLPGLSMIPGKTFSRNSIPGEYLNSEFGLKPFLADLRRFRIAAENAERLINEYAARAGKVIRRRYEFPEDNEITTVVHPAQTGYEKYLGGPCNGQISGYLTPVLEGWPGEMTDVTTRSKKVWFSGAFTYYLPSVGSDLSSQLIRQEAELRHLYGGISVETAWNLLPYSWAADWFTNAGDLVHNLAAFARDGLVMPWGYVMERCELSSTRTVVGAQVGREVSVTFPSTRTYTLPEVSTTYYAKYLRRRKATPFGFGLDVDGFTSRQKAITLALLLR